MKKKIVAIMACAMMLLSVGASAEMTAGNGGADLRFL